VLILEAATPPVIPLLCYNCTRPPLLHSHPGPVPRLPFALAPAKATPAALLLRAPDLPARGVHARLALISPHVGSCSAPYHPARPHRQHRPAPPRSAPTSGDAQCGAAKVENEILLALHTCTEEVLSAEELPFDPVYGSNNLQEIGPISNSGDELPCASMDNQEDKLLLPSFPKEAHIGNVWSASDTRGECHQDQTQLSTYHATREQQIVKIIADLPLLHGDLLVDPCDKEELCDHTSLKSTTQLVHGHVQSDLNDEHVIFPHVRCVNNENEELKLISSLNTLDYTEFDILCNLNCLEKKLFQNCILPYFDHCSFYEIGKYNTRGEYMVRRVYIYSDLKPHLRVSQSDQQITCIESNYTISSFFAIDNMLQVNFQEGEQILLPCILLGVSRLYFKELEKTPLLNNTNNTKPRTVCSQEWENDEDITSMDTTILVPSCPKVNQLYIKIKFDTFEQLMLHYNFCAFSFSELLHWIKTCVEIIWKI
jgi:hypothetical protein